MGKDSVTAITKCDVQSGLTAFTNVVVWYTTTSTGEEYNENDAQATSISSSGFSVTVKAGNRYATKGTAGYSVEFNTRGSWYCGTTYTF